MILVRSLWPLLVICRAGYCGLLGERLRVFDLLHPEDIGHRIVKRATNPSSNQYNHIEDVRFAALGKEFRLTLSSKVGLFAADVEVAEIDGDGNKAPVTVDKRSFYGGHVIGERQSQVNLHLANNQLTGSIVTEQETYYFEPAKLHLPNAADATLVYRKSDVIQSPKLSANSTACGAIVVDDSENEYSRQMQFKDAPDTVHHGRDVRAIPTFEPIHTRCGLRIVADYRFFTSIGGKNSKQTITYLINMIDRVNSIYNATNWNEGHEKDPLLGYGFIIQAMNILVEPTRVKPGEVHYNDDATRRDSKEILDLFSRDSDHQSYCLAHLFTDQVLESGVLGLAYVGNGRRGSAGGICSAPYEKDGRQLFLNSGLTSSRNQFQQIVITREMELVTAHELGHNWGSQHDPETKECTPESRDGGRYLMYMYSVSGLESNNRFFSPCSRRSVRDVLLSKSPGCFHRPEKSLCGNFLVEEGEECDAGFIGADDKDLCCDKRCKLRSNARCSDKNAVCCSNCTYSTKGTKCARESRETCHGASFCTGDHQDCPPPPSAPDGVACFDEGQCRNGQCISFCETKGLKSCVCDNLTESCLVCCRRENHTCHPFDFSGRKTYKIVPDGRPCIQGNCDKGVCEKTVQDFVARMWLVIERIDFSNFAGFLRNNIVGTVIILSLLVWIPASCLVHQMDKQFQEDNPEVYGTMKRSVIAMSTHDVSHTPLVPTYMHRPSTSTATRQSISVPAAQMGPRDRMVSTGARPAVARRLPPPGFADIVRLAQQQQETRRVTDQMIRLDE